MYGIKKLWGLPPLILFGFVYVFATYIYLYITIIRTKQLPFKYSEVSEEISNELQTCAIIENLDRTKIFVNKYLVSKSEINITCKIPYLDSFTPKYNLQALKPLNCTENQFFEIDYLSKPLSIVQAKELNGSGYDECCYMKLQFKAIYNYGKRKDKECFPIYHKRIIIPLDYEYAKIICQQKNNTNESNVHVETFEFVRLKRSVVKTKHLKTRQHNDLVNVVVLGLDAQSRHNFVHLMPETYKYLTELDAIEMRGFNKVGDATLNNSIAFLIGQNQTEIKQGCWRNETTDFFDDCPWIWKDYAKAGYTTSFSDDNISVFNHRFRGFKVPPTNYYNHPFINFLTRLQRQRLFCYDRKMSVNILHGYIKQTAWALRGIPYFQFAWQTRIEKPLEFAALCDISLKETLQFFNDTNLLNKTVVVLISDHGWRTGNLMNIFQGRMENRMPLAYFVFPQWFQQKYAKAIQNMKSNQWRLTTPYDVHKTLQDIANISKISSPNILERRSKSEIHHRGISLFLPVPLNRTCENAGIDEHWCICNIYQPISVNCSLVQTMGNFVVKTLNTWFVDFPQCALYSLKKITFAEVKSENNIWNSNKLNTFKIILQVKPSNASFEATVYRSSDGRLRMSTEISRINTYALQSECVQTYSMKKVCYCKNLT